MMCYLLRIALHGLCRPPHNQYGHTHIDSPVGSLGTHSNKNRSRRQKCALSALQWSTAFKSDYWLVVY